jgi:hypothetical protein
MPSPELARAVSEVQHLTSEITVAEAQLAGCVKSLTSEEGMLASLIATPETPNNKEYLDAAKIACTAGIKAWSLSIAAYLNDIDSYKSGINAILERIPEARMDNVGE